MHNNWSASTGSLDGLKKLSKFENIDSSDWLELVLGIIIDVIREPTNQIDKAFNMANKNEAKMDMETISVYGLQKLNILK